MRRQNLRRRWQVDCRVKDRRFAGSLPKKRGLSAPLTALTNWRSICGRTEKFSLEGKAVFYTHSCCLLWLTCMLHSVSGTMSCAAQSPSQHPRQITLSRLCMKIKSEMSTSFRHFHLGLSIQHPCSVQSDIHRSASHAACAPAGV